MKERHSGKTPKPAIPNRPVDISDELWYFLRSIKEILEAYEGSAGRLEDRILTINDLKKIGIDKNALNTEQASYNLTTLKV